VKRPALLWTLALVLTLAAASWQRRTGPSYPFRTAFTLAGATTRVKLVRSHVTSSPAVVAVPVPRGTSGILHWRRYPTSDAFTPVPMRAQGDSLVAELPVQPAAGKVEYYCALVNGAESERLPDDRAVVLRYRGEVPPWILLPHIALMFIGLLIGTRVALGALIADDERRSMIIAALAVFTVGGLILGPIVQKYAFGAYWTGVPFGWDLTDNKTLLMWVGWLVAALVPRRHERWIVVAAAVLMFAAYVVPHNTFGSQLDYSTIPASSR
jgi:hypothetical protein